MAMYENPTDELTSVLSKDEREMLSDGKSARVNQDGV